MVRLLKINSQALWSLIAAGINLGTLFHWWNPSIEQIAGVNTCYLAGMMVLRQMFSLTPELPTSEPTRTTMQSTSPITINEPESEPVPRFQQPPP